MLKINDCKRPLLLLGGIAATLMRSLAELAPANERCPTHGNALDFCKGEAHRSTIGFFVLFFFVFVFCKKGSTVVFKNHDDALVCC